MAIAGAPSAAPSPAAQPAAAPSVPRGIRNRNAGNLKDGPFARSQPGYVGASGSGNMRFAVFDTPEAGNQAQERLLTNNYLSRGFTTPAAIVNRYAPPGPENSQSSVQNYTNYIASKLGIGPNDNVSPEQVSALAQAMREFENGQTSGGSAPDEVAEADLSALSNEELMALAGDAAEQTSLPQNNSVISETLAPGAPPKGFQGGVPEFDPSVPFMANRSLEVGSREEGRAGRSDEELTAQGYTQSADGSWRFAPSPEQLQTMGYSWNPETNSWDSSVPEEYVDARNAARGTLNEQDTGLQERIRAVSNGASFGFSGELEKALVEAQQRGENFNSTLLGEDIPYSAGVYGDAYADEAEARQQRFREDRPLQSFGLEVGGGLLTPGLAQAGNYINSATGAARTARAAAVSGGQGLLSGAGNAQGSLLERAPEAAVTAGVSAATGGLIDSWMSRDAARLAERNAGLLNNPTNARTLSRAGVELTPGQILGGAARRVEDGLTSVPIFGDAIKEAQRRGVGTFDRAAINEALEPIGATITARPGREAIAEAGDILSNGYNENFSPLTLAPDEPWTAASTRILGARNLSRQARATLADVTADIRERFSGPINGLEWKQIDSELSGMINTAQNGDAANKALARPLRELREAFQGVLQRTDDAAYTRYQALDDAFANFSRIRQAAANPTTARNEGLFSSTNLNSVLARAEGRNYARGEARLQGLTDAAQDVMPATVPDSGTPFRGLLSLGGIGGVGAGAGAAGLPSEAVLAGTIGTAGLLGVGAAAYSRPVQNLVNTIYRATDRQQATTALIELQRLAARDPALQPYYEAAFAHVLGGAPNQSPETAPSAGGLLSPSAPRRESLLAQ